MQDQKSIPVSRMTILILVLINAVVIKQGIIAGGTWYYALIITFPLLVIALINIRQMKHAILSNFPVFGYFRRFFNSDLESKQFNRRQRSKVNQRAKKDKQGLAVGIQSNPNTTGDIFPDRKTKRKQNKYTYF